MYGKQLTRLIQRSEFSADLQRIPDLRDTRLVRVEVPRPHQRRQIWKLSRLARCAAAYHSRTAATAAAHRASRLSFQI